jgi:hypothetical protein
VRDIVIGLSAHMGAAPKDRYPGGLFDMLDSLSAIEVRALVFRATADVTWECSDRPTFSLQSDRRCGSCTVGCGNGRTRMCYRDSVAKPSGLRLRGRKPDGCMFRRAALRANALIRAMIGKGEFRHKLPDPVAPLARGHSGAGERSSACRPRGHRPTDS